MHSTLTLNVVVKDDKYGNLFLQLVLFMMTNYKLIKHRVLLFILSNHKQFINQQWTLSEIGAKHILLHSSVGLYFQ